MSELLNGYTILIADDDAPICDLLCDILEPEGAMCQIAHSGEAAIKLVEATEPDLAIVDMRMPPPDGLALLQTWKSGGSDFPVIIITAQDSSTATIEAMQAGAYDYIAKPFDPDAVLVSVRRALEHGRLTKRLLVLQQQYSPDPRDILIGRSAAMQQVYKLIGRVAASESTVLVTGDSGTGKELVAQVLHRSSSRRDAPFVAVNCAALPETLLESELFGHEKGAFTGAVTQRKGRFELASKGSIFLDEIGEISPTTQKKLLRVLQERNFERVGGNISVRVDVRVITATNRDLLQDVAAGRFREDLYYRLNVVNIHMPPLRDRRDDIPLLVAHFLRRHRNGNDESARLSEAALERLTAYHWPGNVRQLENVIERAVVMAQDSVISPEHLDLSEDDLTQHSPALQQAVRAGLDAGYSLEHMIAQLRAQAIEFALARSNGDRAAAARLLHISEAELHEG
ncbi:MAG: sigma-54-dependent Fis family transcriptional regulator [Oscillochloris sp.]|nr:sigma-54-dependent Fis family transcriptional regulator [Oscillochloris sp.]